MTRIARGLLASLALTLLLTALPGGRAEAASLQISSGDTAWMLTATVLVLMMSVPGLALLYGGLVRTKNTVAMLMQVLTIVCLVCVIWIVYGYSMAFTGGLWSSYFGGLSRAMMVGITADSVAATRVNGVAIPEYAFVAFQMTFACITPALIVGAFAERMRFSSVLTFVALWVTFVYVPIAHMAWYGPSPDALADAARAVQAAATPEAKAKAEAALALVQSDAGLFAQWGTLDFAGGTVVHINAGIAGLMGALALGKRAGYGRVSMAPHSIVLTTTGAALLWVGWLGFNAGSALGANGTAALAMINTFVAAAAAALAWIAVETRVAGKPSLLGVVTGVLAGLVSITPAAGYAGPGGALVLGLVSGAVCFWACTRLKSRFDYDDSLDVFGVHCVAGVIGTLAVALLASPSLGGTGIVDFTITPGSGVVAAYDMGGQLWAQMKAVVFTLLWSSYISARLYTLVDMMTGMRANEAEETKGLDLTDHGEKAYNY
jgi:Amt family ammonium transporter